MMISRYTGQPEQPSLHQDPLRSFLSLGHLSMSSIRHLFSFFVYAVCTACTFFLA